MRAVGRGYADAGIGEAIQGIDLGVLPRFLLRLAAELRALTHGTRLPAVSGFAVFGVVDGLPDGNG